MVVEALLGVEQAWTPIIYLKSFDMDSVQVGKAVFVKESYTTLGIEPRTYSYPGRLVTILVSVGLKKTCGHSPLFPSKVGPPWLPIVRLRAGTLPQPLGTPRTRGTYPLRDRHSPDGMQSRNRPGVKVEQGAGTLA